jgi:predicted O-methyltransferase YrrM
MAAKEKGLINKIDGLLFEEESDLLYSSAKNCQGKGVIVEIGSWKGKSAVCLALGSKAGSNVMVYCVDPHQDTPTHKHFGVKRTYADFIENIKIAGVDDIVLPITKTSKEAAGAFNEPIEFLFIDGEHDFESVKSDVELWFPKVIDGGIIAFHDYSASGVYKVIKKYVYKSHYFRSINLACSLYLTQKLNKNSLKDRLINRILLFLNYFALFYHQLPVKKPALKLRKRIATIWNARQ